MTHYAIVTDLNRCVGCLACMVACKVANNVPIGNYWNKVLRVGPNLKPDAQDVGHDVEMYYLPVGCQHCEEPECVHVCPTGASSIDENGVVTVDESKCIGCKYCMTACPYQVRVHNEKTGAVEKCKFCHHWVYEHPETPSNTCVTACVTGCRIFGDLDDPQIELSRAIVERNALPVAGDLTKAKIFYVR